MNRTICILNRWLAVGQIVVVAIGVTVPVALHAQSRPWAGRIMATEQYLHGHLWNAATGNFVRRADTPDAAGSDAWGITILLDAYAYLVEDGTMTPVELQQYYLSSTMLYEKTGGEHGARILARRGTQIYVGGDDDLQWCAALVHCFQATKDSSYLQAAEWSFHDLLGMNFWITSTTSNGSKGWGWNSGDMRPNGVSTAYGALAAARLYAATRDASYKGWAAASLNALNTPQVGFFPRDEMVAANAALTLYEATHDAAFLERATALTKQALTESREVIAGGRKGELNPTDIGDLAEGLFRMTAVTKEKSYAARAVQLIHLFDGRRSDADIASHGFFSRYHTGVSTSGKAALPETAGDYLGVPLAVSFLPEVAEMLKLFAAAEHYSN